MIFNNSVVCIPNIISRLFLFPNEFGSEELNGNPMDSALVLLQVSQFDDARDGGKVVCRRRWKFCVFFDNARILF